MSFAFKERILAIPASNDAGGASLIRSTIFSRLVDIQEVPDPATFTGSNFSPQGMFATYPRDNYVQKSALEPGEDLILDSIPAGGDVGISIGSPTWTDPAGNSAGGTPLVKLISATTTATTVRVREYPR